MTTYQWRRADDDPVHADPVSAFRLQLHLQQVERDHVNDRWWTALLQLAPTSGGGTITITQLVERAKDAGYAGKLVIPAEYDAADWDDNQLKYVAVFAKYSYLEKANQVLPDGSPDPDLGVERVILGNLIPPDASNLPKSGPPEEEALPRIKLGADAVFTAVIDNGIAIGHDLFRRPDGAGVLNRSRVDLFWNMDGVPENTAPPGSLGRKWRKSQIDPLLAANIDANLLNEPKFYLDLGLIDWSRSGFKPAAQRTSHGTHVMG